MTHSLYKVVFNVPCRQFAVSVTVTKDARLPMVREFTLRYIYIFKDVSVDSLQRFFGFNEHQVETLIAELRDAKLIEYSGERLVLCKKAREMFERAGGAHARFITAEEWKETFAVDFISFRILKRPPLPDTIFRHVALRADDRQKIRRSREIAEQTFADGFQEFLQRCKPMISDEERGSYSIYGIHAIRPKGLFDFPLEVEYAFQVGSENDVVRRYGDFNTDADQERRSELIARIAQETDSLVDASDIPDRIPREVSALFGGSWLSRLLGKEGQLDLGLLYERIQNDDALFDDGCSIAILGGLSEPLNQEALSGFLRDSLEGDFGQHESKQRLSGDAIWLKPCNELSFRSADSLSLFSSIRRNVSSNSDSVCSLYVMLNSGYENVGKFEHTAKRKNKTNVFDAAIKSKAGQASKCIEAVLVPGRLIGLSIFYKPHNFSLPVCFGLISYEKSRVAEFSEFIAREWQGFGRKVECTALRENFTSPVVEGRQSLSDFLMLKELSRNRRGRGGRKILSLGSRDEGK